MIYITFCKLILLSLVMYSLQLRHPFGLLVSGGTKTGKTTFVKKLLSNAQVMIDPPPENIKYFYSEYQDTFAGIKSLVPNIEFIEGVPDVIFDSINPKTRNLYIFDDMMGERDSVIAKLFTKKSHHGNLSVIYIVQNLFHQSKDHRTISLNASYIVLTKNVRDASQVIHLAKQIYPNNVKYFQQAYQMATAEPFSYLFIDLTPTCPDETRFLRMKRGFALKVWHISERQTLRLCPIPSRNRSCLS